jgi:glycosyltransferase involved in cell wall biosynthesis
LSLLHAFGYGLPVVTSDAVGEQNPEIEALRDGENGLLYADGDVEALRGALGRLLGDAELRRSLSGAALRAVSEAFTVQKMVDGFEAAVRYCVDGKGRHSM